MRIAIVQLSDIHFQATSNVLVARVEKIVAAIRPTLQQAQGVVFAVTGDIAHSGDSCEYDVASGCFKNLRDAVEAADPTSPVAFVFIPGNHDCDFRSAGEVRSALIETLSEKIETLDPAGEIARQVTRVHDNFFAFQSRFQNEPEIPPQDRLRYQAKVQLGQMAITFDCYNTAWTSRKNEQAGTLLFPVRLLTQAMEREEDECDVRIALLHHRDNWLESNNARLLRDHLDSYSDLILTGHEHVGDAYRKSKANGTGAQYVEGAVLQDSSNPGNSGFNVLEIDAQLGLRILPFRWSGQRYSAERGGDWAPFEQNRSRGRFQISPSFVRVLRDPGTGFLHPAKSDLSLDDIFVYPDLLRKSLKKIVTAGVSSKVVLGKDVADFVISSGRMMISGPDDSGRSSLARSLYQDLRQRHRLVPVFVNGEDIHGRNVEMALKREVDRSLGVQYSGDVAEAYHQLDRNRKILIVDDWHKIKYGEHGQSLLLEQAEKCFANVLCFADDMFAVDQLAGTGAKPFRDYEICEIRELGHLRRNELIRKWYLTCSPFSEQVRV